LTDAPSRPHCVDQCGASRTAYTPILALHESVRAVEQLTRRAPHCETCKPYPRASHPLKVGISRVLDAVEALRATPYSSISSRPACRPGHDPHAKNLSMSVNDAGLCERTPAFQDIRPELAASPATSPCSSPCRSGLAVGARALYPRDPGVEDKASVATRSASPRHYFSHVPPDAHGRSGLAPPSPPNVSTISSSARTRLPSRGVGVTTSASSGSARRGQSGLPGAGGLPNCLLDAESLERLQQAEKQFLTNLMT
jgi:hypothetical protein